MEKFKFDDEEKIRAILEEVFLIEDTQGYLLFLRKFFIEKARDAISAMSNSDNAESYYKKYKTETSVNEIRDALEDYLIVDDFLNIFNNIIDEIVRKEATTTTHVNVDINTKKDMEDAFVALFDEYWNKYAERIMPSKIRALYEHTYGINKSMELSYCEVIERYDLKG